MVGLGIQIAESEVLEFAADFAHSQTVSQRRVNIHGLARNGFSPVGGKISKRPYVVEAVGEFHHDDANVIRHGEQHLAEILGLLFFFGCERNLADLGYAIDDMSDFGAEKLFDFLERGQGVFDDVVQESDADGYRIHLLLRQKIRDFERMR